MSASIRTLCCSISRPYSLIAVCLGSGASTGVATSAVAISPPQTFPATLNCSTPSVDPSRSGPRRRARAVLRCSTSPMLPGRSSEGACDASRRVRACVAPDQRPERDNPGLEAFKSGTTSVGDLSGRLELAPQPRFSFFIEVQQAGVSPRPASHFHRREPNPLRVSSSSRPRWCVIPLEARCAVHRRRPRGSHTPGVIH